jgi:hypothetical protein
MNLVVWFLLRGVVLRIRLVWRGPTYRFFGIICQILRLFHCSWHLLRMTILCVQTWVLHAISSQVSACACIIYLWIEIKPMAQHWRCKCRWQGCTYYSRKGMWPFWSVVLMAVMRRRLLSHGCGCAWYVVLRASELNPPFKQKWQEMTNKFKQSTTNKKMAYVNKHLSLIWK